VVFGKLTGRAQRRIGMTGSFAKNLFPNNVWYRLPGASSLDLPVIAEHYQKRIHPSRYFGWGGNPKSLFAGIILKTKRSAMHLVEVFWPVLGRRWIHQH
jgi:hypothetical protein